MRNLRILLFAENASDRFGGEAAIAFNLYEQLRSRDEVEVWFVTHVRNRDEWLQRHPEDTAMFSFIPDTRVHRFLSRLANALPRRVAPLSAGLLLQMWGEWIGRRIVRRLVSQEQIDVVHQPMPVSPLGVSLLCNIGAPIMIGPMNGAMEYPPAFNDDFEPRWVRRSVAIARRLARFVHLIFQGKRQAALLLAANDRTRRALKSISSAPVQMMVENAADLSIWRASKARKLTKVVRFAFMGRLVDWKGVGFLLDAFEQVRRSHVGELLIVGDGPLRSSLESRVDVLQLRDSVRFTGWQPQWSCARLLAESDVFVLPSLYECGGAVVLEAMATGLPVIATNWGGPADYLDASCGILVDPTNRYQFVADLANAMIALARDPEVRCSLGQAGREKVLREFNWQSKVDHLIQIYRNTVDAFSSQQPAGIRQLRDLPVCREISAN